MTMTLQLKIILEAKSSSIVPSSSSLLLEYEVNKTTNIHCIGNTQTLGLVGTVSTDRR
jgi:hypothetical protein